MAKTSSQLKLQVLMNAKYVGDLIKRSDGGLYFYYSSYWLNHNTNFPISRQLPVTEKPYSGEKAQNYFENLLPDIKSLREKIAAVTRARSTSTFDLLSVLGRDCIGALQFVPEGEAANKKLALPKGEPLTEKQIATILKNLKFHPLGIDKDQDFRISLTGAQEKTALLRKAGRWFRPIGESPTTHILKPALGIINDGVDLSTSVENEWLCHYICKLFGLRVAHSEMVVFNGTRVLVVERFDRKWVDKKLLRLPQEDMCQALGYPTAQKYQNDGGPGIMEIMNLLKESSKSQRDRIDFLKSQIVFWLLAAIDGHAKNFSIHLLPGGFELCPLYDILSAEPSLARGELNRFDIKMAMNVGQNRKYKVKDIAGRQWLQMEDVLRIPKGTVVQILSEIKVAVPSVLKDAKKALPKRFPKDVSEPIFEGIQNRIKLI